MKITDGFAIFIHSLLANLLTLSLLLLILSEKGVI